MRGPSGVFWLPKHFAIEGQDLTDIHPVLLVHRAGVGHVLENEIQKLLVTG